ncbi:glycosyltransferase [Neobacillus niacini]|uniref:glycosyltransferase n=1 Tax=Neobacillus niacini TaxID=86668 RepID=UPI002FFF282D
MKYLILIDTKFPYRAGESFLESEISEISAEFDRIFIFPTDAMIRDPQTRKIDEQNVTTELFESSNTKFRKGKCASKAIFTMWGYHGRLKHRFLDAYFDNAARDQAMKIIHYLKKNDFQATDQVFVYSYWFYITARIAIEIKTYFQEIGIPVKTVSRAHRFDIYEDIHQRGYLPRRQFLLENLDKVFPCSDNGTHYLEKKFPAYGNKITTARLGTYDHGEGVSDRKEWFHLISCSRVTSIKRVDRIIDTLKILEGEGYQIAWTHIGGGPLLDKVKEKANGLKVSKVVFKGSVANTQVYEYYRQNPADLFVNVSTSEGLPVSIMEAISFGIPTIATDVGGTSEIVVNNVSGYLLNKNFSDRELADKIACIIRMSDNEYTHLRRSARRYWFINYQANKNYKDFAENILQLM